jgi:hypothetical protein
MASTATATAAPAAAVASPSASTRDDDAGRSVIIIGAGLAGLMAAYELIRSHASRSHTPPCTDQEATSPTSSKDLSDPTGAAKPLLLSLLRVQEKHGALVPPPPPPLRPCHHSRVCVNACVWLIFIKPALVLHPSLQLLVHLQAQVPVPVPTPLLPFV